MTSSVADDLWACAKQAFAQGDAALGEEIAAIVCRIAPGFRVYHALAQLQAEADRFEPAAAAMARALSFEPDSFEGRRFLAYLLVQAHRLDDALAEFTRALSLRPDHVETRLNQAFAQLAKGDLANGLAGYELRFAYRTAKYSAALRQRPAWEGQATDRPVFVFCEQGIGDAIMFARYVEPARRRCPNLIVGPIRGLTRLFARHFPCNLADTTPLAAIDLHRFIMSLPLALGMASYDAVPAAPYLAADPALVAAWAPRIQPSARPKIGLVWRGGAKSELDRYRSMPAASLAPLADLPVDFYSLQLPATVERPAFARDLTPDIRDFDDTAAIIAQLDLVISVDTAAAHLAGALGKPVWILLSWLCDWRWMLDRADTPWYATARLFRQPRPGDWDSVIATVRRALLDLARG